MSDADEDLRNAPGKEVAGLAQRARVWCPDLTRLDWGTTAQVDLLCASYYLREVEGLKAQRIAERLGVSKQYAYAAAERCAAKLTVFRRRQRQRELTRAIRRAFHGVRTHRADDPRQDHHPDLGDFGSLTPEDVWRGA